MQFQRFHRLQNNKLSFIIIMPRKKETPVISSMEEQYIIRQILTAISEDESLSQRSLATRIGISVGSVNWYVKRCVSKGLIKLKEAPFRRYLYYLTPKGFEEKACLTASYIRHSLDLFRQGRADCSNFFQKCQNAGYTRLALAGDGELAEIAVLSTLEYNLCLLAVIDPLSQRSHCVGLPVVATIADLANIASSSPPLSSVSDEDIFPQRLLLTDLNNPHTTYSTLVAQLSQAGLDKDIIEIPTFLR